MKTFIRSLVFVTFICLTLGFACNGSWAEEMNFTIDSYVIKVESIPLADAEGHVLMLGERRGVANFDDGSVAAYHTSFICDVSKMMGPCEGYTDLTFTDKSQTFSKYKLTVGIPEGKQLPELKGTGNWIKGIGEYEGIEGNFSFSGYMITPYNEVYRGDMVLKVSGSYKLPAK